MIAVQEPKQSGTPGCSAVPPDLSADIGSEPGGVFA